MLRILISAYACEPGKGSEPGVGWKWTQGLAKDVELTVLTRANNQNSIEELVNSLPANHPLKNVRFLYHDLHKFWLWAKRRHFLPALAYYIMWQWSVSRRFGAKADSHDIVHHLTFCTLLCPGFWKLQHAKFILGPVGAPLVNPYYYSVFGRHSWLQRIRGLLMEHFLHLPWLKRLLAHAQTVIPANSETRDLLKSHGVTVREVMLDTGAPDLPRDTDDKTTIATSCCRFIFAGSLERRKGLELSLRAFARASDNINHGCYFKLIGNGPDRIRLEKIATELGIADRIVFTGAISHDGVLEQFKNADVFLFTSVRDTSAGVNLEAMACGLPVVCISQHGVADITTDDCALRVSPGTVDETIVKLADAIERIANDPSLRLRLGKEAKRRALEDFSWSSKFRRMLRIYCEASNEEE